MSLSPDKAFKQGVAKGLKTASEVVDIGCEGGCKDTPRTCDHFTISETLRQMANGLFFGPAVEAAVAANRKRIAEERS